MFAAMSRKSSHFIALGATITLLLIAPMLGALVASAGPPADGELGDEPTMIQSSAEPTDTDGPVTTDPEPKASIALRHSVIPGTVTVGDFLTFTWEITNTGNVTLHDVVLLATSLDGTRSFDGYGTPIADASGVIAGPLCFKIGDPFTSFEVLAPGETITCRADPPYQTVDKDASQGSVTSWAHVTAKTPVDYVGDAVHAEDFASARVKQATVLTGGSLGQGTTGAATITLLGVLAGVWLIRRKMVFS